MRVLKFQGVNISRDKTHVTENVLSAGKLGGEIFSEWTIAGWKYLTGGKLKDGNI